MKRALKKTLNRLNEWARNIGLPLFLFLLPWQTRWIFGDVPLESGATQYGILSVYATQVLLLAVVLFSGRPRFDQESKLPAVFACALFLIVAISSFFSIESLVSIVQLMHVAFSVLLFLAVLDARVDVRRAALGFACGLVVPVFLGAAQVLLGGTGTSMLLGLAARDAAVAGDAVIQTPGGARILRAYGSFPHPNIFGGYLAVAVIAGGWLIYKGVRGRMMGVSRSPFLLLLFGLALTMSRSAWLGLLLAVCIGALVYMVKNVRLARLFVIPVTVGFIAAVFVASFGFGFVARPGSDAAFEDRSVAERTEQYREYPTVIQRRGLIGLGIGTYVFAHEDMFPQREWWQHQPIHNTILLLLAEVGIFGIAVAVLWAGSIDRVNMARLPNPDAIVALMMGSVLLVVLFFDHYPWSSWAGLALVAFVMGMTVRLGKESIQAST